MKSIREMIKLAEAKKKMKGEDPCWADYEMVGTKKKNGKEVPNCVPKNEEVEHIEESATVLAGRPTTHAEHHYSTSAGSHPASHVEKTLGLKSGSISKDKKTYIKHGDVHVRTTPAGKHVQVSLARKHGKFGQDTSKHDQQRENLRSKLLKTNEEVEHIEEMDKSQPSCGRDGKISHSTYGSRDRDDKDDYFKGKESTGKPVTRTQAIKDALKILKKSSVKEETQIDELNKDTVYSYNKKANNEIETLHKKLGAQIRKGAAPEANKTAHKLNKRVQGTERAEKRLEANEQIETAAQVVKHFEKGESTKTGVPKWVAEPTKSKKKKVEEAGDPELMGGAVSKPTASGNNPKLADKFMKAFRKMKSPANISCKTVGMTSTCESEDSDAGILEAAKKKEPTKNDAAKSGKPVGSKQEPISLNPELKVDLSKGR